MLSALLLRAGCGCDLELGARLHTYKVTSNFLVENGRRPTASHCIFVRPHITAHHTCVPGTVQAACKGLLHHEKTYTRRILHATRGDSRPPRRRHARISPLLCPRAISSLCVSAPASTPPAPTYFLAAAPSFRLPQGMYSRRVRAPCKASRGRPPRRLGFPAAALMDRRRRV